MENWPVRSDVLGTVHVHIAQRDQAQFALCQGHSPQQRRSELGLAPGEVTNLHYFLVSRDAGDTHPGWQDEMCGSHRWKRPCPYHVTEATYGGRPRPGLEIPVTGGSGRWRGNGRSQGWGARDEVPSGRCWWRDPALRVFGLSLSSLLFIFREIQHFYLVSLISRRGSPSCPVSMNSVWFVSALE